MRFRLVVFSALIIILSTVSNSDRRSAASVRTELTKSVYLGGIIFQPPNVVAAGTATLTVSIATGTDVPPIGADNSMPIKAVVQINENSNTSSINYTITPSQVEKVDLNGTGKSSMINFKFVMNSQNTKGGAISCRATLVSLENAGSMAQLDGPTAMDAVLYVAPPPTPTPTPLPTPEPTP